MEVTPDFLRRPKVFAGMVVRAGCLAVIALGLLACLPAARAGEPRRIMLYGQCLFEDYLRERLPADARVQVNDVRRSTAILAEIGIDINMHYQHQGDFRCIAPAAYSSYCAYSPAEFLLFVHQLKKEPRDITLAIHRKGQVSQKHFPYNPDDPGSFLAMTRAALAWVADQCGFAPEEKDALLDVGFADGELLRQFHLARSKSARGVNLGQLRNAALLPLLSRDPSNPILAAEIIRNVELQHATIAFSSDSIAFAQSLLPLVLGTPYEASAHAILQRFPERFDKLLRNQCSPLAGELDIEDTMAAISEDTGAGPPTLDMRADVAPTPQRAKGALRLLGVIQSKPGLPLLVTASKHADATVRAAAADGLAGYDDKAALPCLRALANDKDDRVAFAASFGLWARGVAHPRLLPLARTFSGAKEAACRARSLAVLEALGEAQDAPALRRLCGEADPDLRRSALRGLIRLKSLDNATLACLLDDQNEPVVELALSALPAQPDAALMAQVRRLADDPLESIAEAARMHAAKFRPKDERGAIAFDLELEHTYIRLRRIEQLRGIKEPWATDLLDASCSNRNAYVRSAALAEIVRRDPRRGHDRAAQAMSDATPLVRFAAAEALAKLAAPADAGALGKALATETDLATRVCLREALAKAEGKPPPPPPPSARSVMGPQIQTWIVGVGEETVRAPVSADLAIVIDREAGLRRLHEAGKTIFGRVLTFSNPGLLMVDRKERDLCWKRIDASLTEMNLRYLDGLAFGEDLTMGVMPAELWTLGWRLYCLDAGLDPARVMGAQTNLSVPEQRAWEQWAGERCMDGFNAMYDYVKWKVAKLRPGIQVCTYMQAQSASFRADERWKFDVGAMRDLKRGNRMDTYAIVRHHKTLWPDRPVILISAAADGVSALKRFDPLPVQPLNTRRYRAWANAVTAWIAGADVGWEGGWVLMDEKHKGIEPEGARLELADLYPGSLILSNAVASAFTNAARYDSQKVATGPSIDSLSPGAEVEAPALDLDADQNAGKAAREKVSVLEAEKTAMADGLLFYGKYAGDCARAFAGLPRQNPRPATLVIQTNASFWFGPATGYPEVPGVSLLNEYDFLYDFNQLASLDLSRYRLIVVADHGLLRDTTLAALTRWLKDQPGLLYIHGQLQTNKAAEASVIGDMDGVLKNAWPWEADIAAVPAATPRHLTTLGVGGAPSLTNAQAICDYALRDPSARALLSAGDGKPLLVSWRRPDAFKGAVLFDGVANAPKAYLEALRGQINALQKEQGIGLALTGPLHHIVLQTSNFLAAASSRFYPQATDEKAYAGLDLLTGEFNPVVGPDASGVLIARDYIGTYAASLAGLAVLSSEPIKLVERAEGGLRLQSEGLVRAASGTGRVSIRPQGGNPLPAVKDPAAWILHGADDGIATLSPPPPGTPATYFRCKRPVIISGK